PNSRMGTANLVRTALQQARGYGEKKPATPNLKHEAMDLVLKKKMPIILSGHRADDLMTGLRIAKEFELNAMLTLATEGYLIPDAILAARVPVIVHPTMQRPSSPETFNGHLGNAAFLVDRKIPTAICTAFEGYVPKTRVLRYEAAMAAVNGLGHERALKAITLDAARILGIAEHHGSLEPGKAADLVLFDGDPANATIPVDWAEHTTQVSYTI